MSEQLNLQPDPNQLEQFDATVTEAIQAGRGTGADISNESVISPDGSAEVYRNTDGYGGVKNVAEKVVSAQKGSPVENTEYKAITQTGVPTYNDNGMRNGETTRTVSRVTRHDSDGNEIYRHDFKSPEAAAKIGRLIAKQTTEQIEQRNIERANNRAA